MLKTFRLKSETRYIYADPPLPLLFLSLVVHARYELTNGM